MRELLIECLTGVLTIAVTCISTVAVRLISAKMESIIATTEDSRKAKFLSWIENEVVVNCINSTTQTFVEGLKKDNAFTKEAQKQAIDKTIEQVLSILTESNSEILSDYVGDINVWLTSCIESHILQSKYE